MTFWNILKWVLLIGGLVISLFAAYKLGYFENQYVLTGTLAVGVTTSLGIGLAILTGAFGNKGAADRTDDTAYYFSKINECLMKRPAGDIIDWTGGQYVKLKRKIFTDNKGQEHEFIGVVGSLKDYKKEIVIIYNVLRDDIEEYYGEPSPHQINNPFYGFDPFNKKPEMQMFGNPYAQRYGQDQGRVNINLNNKGDASQVHSLGDRAAEVMAQFKEKNG